MKDQSVVWHAVVSLACVGSIIVDFEEVESVIFREVDGSVASLSQQMSL